MFVTLSIIIVTVIILIIDSSVRTACHVCGKYFYTGASLRMHILRVHSKVESNAQDVEQQVEAVGNKGSVCTVCNRCFANDRTLKLHAHKVHSDIAAAQGGKTGGAQDGEEHVEAVGKKGSTCTACNGYFLNDRVLKLHALKVHRDTAAASTAKRGSRSTVMQTSMKQQ